MILTDEMKEAMRLIQSSSLQPVYITGKAGTGKTTLLKYITENVKTNIVVTASTGIAAINAGGVTLHSLFEIPITIISPNTPLKTRVGRKKADVIKAMKILVIDEISMVRADILDFVDKRLQQCRSDSRPFGGVKVVMFGDLFQLPPVVKTNEESILKMFYPSPYFYNAHVFDKCGFAVIELTKVFRQENADFVKMLNHVRSYRLLPDDMVKLRRLYNPEESQNFNNGNIHICSLRRDVAKINSEQLGDPTHNFIAEIKGEFSKDSAPCDEELKIRVGAKVMMLTNDPLQLYCNGTLGVVTNISNDTITVKLDNGLYVDVSKFEWKACDYEMKDEKIVTIEKGSCRQFPITLAWAITIHKSQGLTFDNVTIHAKNIFAPGQLYVALSRCRTMDGIILDTPVTKRHVLYNKELLAFERMYQSNQFVFDSKVSDFNKVVV